jgi:hypothetical protein
MFHIATILKHFSYKLKEIDHLGIVNVDGRIILKYILGYIGYVRVGFVLMARDRVQRRTCERGTVINETVQCVCVCVCVCVWRGGLTARQLLRLFAPT